MLTIDGSFGEGGGQILRSSLCLSMITQEPFRIEGIRAGRRKPGLMRQHLTAVQAAKAISCAEVEGDEIGSKALTFIPGEVIPGHYQFSIGTAGSTTLVLQTILPALLTADHPSTIILEGGTHNPFAPPYDFLVKAFLPQIHKMGPNIILTLERYGFFPAGGGRFIVEINPSAKLKPIHLLERGKLLERSAHAYVSNLPDHIATRELNIIKRKFNWRQEELHAVNVQRSHGPGNLVTLSLEHENVTELFTGFGEVNRPAEAVAKDAARQCQQYLKSDAPVGEYLTDQLLLPMALAGEGSFRSTGLSRHAITHIELIQQFLDIDVETDENYAGDGVLIKIHA